MSLNFYVDVFKALGHPLRLKLARRLLTKECHIMKLVEEFGEPQPAISQHLQILRNAGVVVGERKGNLFCHVVEDERVKNILAVLGDFS